MIKGLFQNIRFYIIAFSILLAIGILIYVKQTYPEESTRIVKLTQIYALTAVTFLYVTLLASPITRIFTFLPFRGKYLKARRSLGISAFMFSVLHAYNAFFGELGGFGGLPFLAQNYLIAVTLGAISLTIMTLMALTANEKMVEVLTFLRWKMLHRLVYLVAVFTVIHALMIGSHFADLYKPIPTIFGFALMVLVILEAIRFDRYLKTKFVNLPQFGISMFLVAFVIGAILYGMPVTSSLVPGLGIHSAHIQMAKEASNGNTSVSNIPGLDGDRTKRYSVRFDHPENIIPGQQVDLKFRIFDASNGSEVRLFKPVSEKLMHLIIVDSELNYFSHIHPNQTEQGFEITTDFPKNGQYRLYVDFQPLGGIEQQFAFSANVGNVTEVGVSKHEPDNLTKTIGKYEVTLDIPQPLNSKAMSVGEQKFTFTIKDDNTKQGIATLKPYLGSYGHLVMIKKDTYDYLHVHPANLTPPQPNQDGGPTVEFLPIGIYGPIKPGIYRVFGQFNPNGELIVADFTVEVK